jgi:L-Lysine epsilon oxidase N-terminal/L-lysine epsilon oxidase C-terminal domain
MPATFRIHPAIGIARLGTSPTSFYIAPETAGGLPIDAHEDGTPVVGPDGKEQPVTNFRDNGLIRRQAARFRVFAYDDDAPEGREIKIGDTFTVRYPPPAPPHWGGGKLKVTITDIAWTVYPANKKASWYTFMETAGEHGYAANHPLRNASITDAGARQKLIIDPGSQTVSYRDKFGGQTHAQAQFAATGAATQSFPPPLQPNSITTLGELICTQQDSYNRLLVLGGSGNSGSMKSGFSDPKIENYANNDGWFDDICDGPVNAALSFTILEIDDVKVEPGNLQTGSIPVGDGAWVIVAYPRYAPEIVDIVTMDDLLFDLSVRNFGFAPYMYGVPPFNVPPPSDGAAFSLWLHQARWNQDYHPYFERDIWPILKRPFDYLYVTDPDEMLGGAAHETGPHGNFDKAMLAMPPRDDEDPELRDFRDAMRQFLYWALRKPGQENDFYAPPHPKRPVMYLMPRLCGDNPLAHNDTPPPSKFLRLTDTMLFILKQWADGKFINEALEGIDPGPQHPGDGIALDRGVLGSVLGGSFCPGAEATWIMRNPAIYSAPYRIRHATGEYTPIPGSLTQPAVVANADTTASLANGLEPGDISKYDAVPWQADFNQCSTQPIDITYRDWNAIYPASTGDPVVPVQTITYWWPAHRPMSVNGTAWSPTAQTSVGNFQMVTEWAKLGFVTRNPEFAQGYKGPVDPYHPVFQVTEAGT